MEDVLENVLRVGRACGIEDRASEVVAVLQERIDRVAERASTAVARPKTVCLEWLDPLFLGGHWVPEMVGVAGGVDVDRKSTRLNSSHVSISYAVFCLKKKKKKINIQVILQNLDSIVLY